MIILQQLFNLIKLLNSEKGEVSIAAGFALGMVLGFVPANALIIGAIFFFFCILRINGAAMFLAWPLFKLLAFPLDPLFDRLGYALLTWPALQSLWTKAYNAPLLPWTRFNNSVVAGSLAAGLILFLPALFFFRWLIRRYRESVWRRLSESKPMKVLKATTLYQWYEKYQNLKGVVS